MNINWKELCGSRCAIDSFYEWMDERLTDKRLIMILRLLGLHDQADQINKYLYKYQHNLLKSNIKRAFNRHNV